ncbi:MAG: ribose 5-phosphate isomerase B [Candidatus Aenigmatarchaeota archaeon]
MKIAIGSDHAGYKVKENLIKALSSGHSVKDCGAPGEEEPSDYPDIAEKVGKLVAAGKAERGILVCGTGIGMSIAANKVKGVRAAICRTREDARLSREHNDANVLCLGARIVSPELIIEIAKAWLSADFSGGKHEARVEKIKKLEEKA